MTEFNEHSTAELFGAYREILTELKARGIIRTENAPAGDYAEYLVARAFPESKLAPNSEKGWDVLTKDGTRLQVKCRVLSELNQRSKRQLSPFRTFDFDYAAVVLLNGDYTVFLAGLVPKTLIEDNSTHRDHINGSICFATDELLNHAEVKDITAMLKSAAGENMNGFEEGSEVPTPLTQRHAK